MLNQTSCIFTKIEEHRNTKLCSWKNEHFLCGSSFPDKVTCSKRREKKKKKSNQKLNHVLIKARQKEKERELHSWQRLRWGKEINKNAFLQCLGLILLSQEKAPNQSQLESTFSFPSTSNMSHCRMTVPGSIFSQWDHGFMLQFNLIILCVSVPRWLLALVLML